ncbi:DUF2625 family protein [Streptomyces sp. ISL-94]|uniref:DUF2625 family protein n=1 Tax=Streptomyces sp. ISL-94 TaxID=2819190 RepID=UPI0027E4680A|nr:DUF2625 family protein [Streptomyces sp. ISL-94]
MPAPDSDLARASLLQLQATTRSYLGVVVLHCGGLLLHDGWVRVFGRMRRARRTVAVAVAASGVLRRPAGVLTGASGGARGAGSQWAAARAVTRVTVPATAALWVSPETKDSLAVARRCAAWASGSRGARARTARMLSPASGVARPAVGRFMRWP